MGYFESYQAEAFKPNIVDKEGRYEIKVDKVLFSGPQDEKRYTRIDCIIRAAGYPHISLFLTEGKSFNATLTAFYDTFNIPRGSSNTDEWIGAKGFIDITFKEKDGYKNMIPHYITGPDGYVVRPGQTVQQQNSPAIPMQQQVAQVFGGEALPDDGEIPF